MVYDVIDDGYNKYVFKDCDGFLDWFFDDEKKYDKLYKFIIKEVV